MSHSKKRRRNVDQRGRHSMEIGIYQRSASLVPASTTAIYFCCQSQERTKKLLDVVRCRGCICMYSYFQDTLALPSCPLSKSA
jgi:hypothetical protein